jgi:lysophospholipase L1-like esterase
MKNKKGRKTPKVISKKRPPISPSRRRLYILIMLLLPFLFFAVLELSLQIFNYGDYPKLFVSIPDENSPYYGINVSIGKRYFYWSSFSPTPRKDLFLKEKPKNCYRIFVLGGSTTAGFPYGNNLTFARILNRRLADTFPDRCIEVVNTAMTAINSYTMLDFMDEILEQKPDAILIYAGHNEFYGALGVGSMESLGQNNSLVRAYLRLQRFKTFILLRDAIREVYKLFGSEVAITNDPTQTEMSRIVKEQTIPLGSDLYEAGKEQFRYNLQSILEKPKEAGIPVLISELVSNIRDQKPFISINDKKNQSADSVYNLARQLEAKNEFEKAKQNYFKAKDLDALRFRAPEEFNGIIHSLAEEFNIPVVPMKSYFESASPNGLIGNNLMNEHLHPNIDGYFLMADAFYKTMKQEKLIDNNWHTTKPSAYYQNNWGFTRLDSAYASLAILQLKGGWPFKKEGPNMALYNYVPETKEDSIAQQILMTGRLTLEMGHMELARYYENKKNYEQAFLENKALIYTVPKLDLFYGPALKVLLAAQQYKRALLLFEDALKYNQSGFIYKWIGQLLLAAGDPQKGIIILEKAKVLLPDDTQLLFNLTRAYYNTSQLEKGDAILTQLKSMSINKAAINQLESYRKLLKKNK